MQTFLPYPNFEQSAKVLDRQRLGKQRVEVLTLLKGGWKNHPASKMWHGHERYLALYGMAICDEWISRGYKDTCREKIKFYFERQSGSPPPWLGREDFHASHRSNLLRKSPDYYGKFGWAEGPDLPYVWPC